MKERHSDRYELPSGIEIEIETKEERRFGASDVSASRGEEDGKFSFEKVIQPIGEVSQLIFDALKESVKQPDSITVEFGASIKGKTKLLIVSGETDANIKVQMTWKNTGDSEV